MTSRCLSIFILLLHSLLLCPPTSYGLGSSGPSISASGASSAKVTPVEEDQQFDLSLQKSKQSFEAVAPAGNLLAGDWYIKFQQDHESRTYTGTSAAVDFTAKYRELGTNYFGAIYANESLIPKTKIYLIAGRFGLRSLNRDVRPMGEYYAILSLKLSDYGINLFPGESDKTTLLLRLRNWNYGNKYTPIFMQKISLGDGFSLDIGIISHVKLSWSSKDDVWGVYLNGEGSSQQYPVRDNGQTIWINGHVVDGYMGVRRHLASILYVAAEGGMHQDHSTYYNEKGDIIREQIAEFAPWLRVRLETFIP